MGRVWARRRTPAPDGIERGLDGRGVRAVKRRERADHCGGERCVTLELVLLL
jgi:hypothetical protein